MILRTGTGAATRRELSQITGFAPGRNFNLSYPVELLPIDRLAGLTLTAAYLVIVPTFGATPALISRSISTLPNPSVGQITDDASSGSGALYFALSPVDTVQLASACAYEVVVVDSAGRETTLDRGAIIADVAAVGSVTGVSTDVASVAMTPQRASVIVTHGTVITAGPLDVNGMPLGGRTITWTSSNVGVVTVDDTGAVTPVGNGSAIITATCEGISGICTVTSEVLVIGSQVRLT